MIAVSGDEHVDFNLIFQLQCSMQMFLITQTKSNSCCEHRPQNIAACHHNGQDLLSVVVQLHGVMIIEADAAVHDVL